MEITLYNFTKRINSTLQPSNGITVNVQLKMPTSILKPHFTFATIDSTQYNYCRAFGNYYYIKDWSYQTSAITEISCDIDVLASYRDNIMSTRAVVDYSSSNYTIHATDPRCGQSNNGSQYSVSVIPPLLNTASGQYVLRAVGNGSFAHGFATCYRMSSSDLQGLVDYFVTTQSAWDELVKKFKSPYDSIIDCIYMPVTSDVYQTTSISVNLGGVDTGINGAAIMTASASTGTIALAIPWHFSDFRNGPPYTTASLFLPYIGMCPLNISDYYNTTTLTIDYAISPLSGDIIYKTRAGSSSNVTNTFVGNLAQNMPIGQVVSNAQALISGGVALTAGAVSTALGNPVAGAGALSSIIFGVNERSPSVGGTIGGSAGRAMGNAVILTLYCKEATINPSSLTTTSGRVCGQSVLLSSLSGYAQCYDASVSANASNDVISSINNYLNGGVYLE